MSTTIQRAPRARQEKMRRPLSDRQRAAIARAADQYVGLRGLQSRAADTAEAKYRRVVAAGRRAFARGSMRFDNPHPAETVEAAGWALGFLLARERAQAEAEQMKLF